ncbi:MAG: hypothetical protein JXD19_05990, partial [Deltaproteobacteria bacterium]|nr:hypothetical protein [Deltaproteobacteria bacterium]
CKMSRRDLVFGLSFVDSNTGVAVGNRGLILRTTNAGQDWTKIDSNTFHSFNDVILRGNRGWIVGQGGVILHSEDSGRTWTPQQSGIEPSLMQVIFLNEAKGITIGETGTILKTDDGGNSWVPVEIDWFSVLPECLIEMGVIAPNLYDLFFINDLKGWMVGDYGIVLATSDGGTSWNLLRAGQLAPLFTVFFVGANEGWAAGQNGLLLYTNDGGENWGQIDVPTKASLHRIFLCGQEGFIVGDQATILQTCNSGRSWTSVELNIPPPYPWFGDIAVTANSCPTELVVGGSGLIRKMSLSVNLEQ